MKRKFIILLIIYSGVTVGGGQGAQCPFREFPLGNFWRLIGKNNAKENVEENEENRKGKEENEEKMKKGRRKI